MKGGQVQGVICPPSLQLLEEQQAPLYSGSDGLGTARRPACRTRARGASSRCSSKCRGERRSACCSSRLQEHQIWPFAHSMTHSRSGPVAGPLVMPDAALPARDRPARRHQRARLLPPRHRMPGPRPARPPVRRAAPRFRRRSQCVSRVRSFRPLGALTRAPRSAARAPPELRRPGHLRSCCSHPPLTLAVDQRSSRIAQREPHISHDPARRLLNVTNDGVDNAQRECITHTKRMSMRRKTSSPTRSELAARTASNGPLTEGAASKARSCC